MVELADIFTRHGPAYRAKFAERMPPSHLKAMDDIENCRTPALGGSVYRCPDHPEQLEYSYHSCSNRACPKCQNGATTRWLEKQRELLLPVDCFLVTFTLPAQCRPVARSNQKAVYNAFFRASSRAFIELAAEPKHLGGLTAMVGVLQTWRRDMQYHVHIHYIVPGGALSPDGTRWLPHRYDRWLVPEQALAARFKKKFRRELEKAGLFDQLDPRIWDRDRKWVADCSPVGSGEQALQYVAPYVYRVAISNSRIESLEDGKVTFRFKDRDTGGWHHPTVGAEEFIRRFLQHVLPRGFVKVRYYGFLSAGKRKEMLPLIRRILDVPDAPREADAADPATDYLPDEPVSAAPRCPKCGKSMAFAGILRPRRARQRAPPA